MNHCPNGGAKHKKYYVRTSPRVVQCMHDLCNKMFLSPIEEKEPGYEIWTAVRETTNVLMDELLPPEPLLDGIVRPQVLNRFATLGAAREAREARTEEWLNEAREARIE